MKKNKIEIYFYKNIFIKITMFGFNYRCKVYPEQQAILKTTPVIQFGFLFVERKRRKRNLTILKTRSETIEPSNVDLNLI